jgi:hypothetical protein
MLHRLSVTEAAVVAGDLTSEDLARDCLAWIEKRDPVAWPYARVLAVAQTVGKIFAAVSRAAS